MHILYEIHQPDKKLTFRGQTTATTVLQETKPGDWAACPLLYCRFAYFMKFK